MSYRQPSRLAYELVDAKRVCPGIHKVRVRPATRMWLPPRLDNIPRILTTMVCTPACMDHKECIFDISYG